MDVFVALLLHASIVSRHAVQVILMEEVNYVLEKNIYSYFLNSICGIPDLSVEARTIKMNRFCSQRQHPHRQGKMLYSVILQEKFRRPLQAGPEPEKSTE